MKILSVFISSVILLTFLTACNGDTGNDVNPESDRSTGVSDTSDTNTQTQTQAQAQTDPVQSPSPSQKASDIIDLTKENITMQIAFIQNILQNPKSFLGQTIKIVGNYSVYYWDETDIYYHFVNLYDETACCTYGFEFVFADEKTYPDDYPHESALIEVVGVFGSYEELGNTYYNLTVDKLNVLS